MTETATKRKAALNESESMSTISTLRATERSATAAASSSSRLAEVLTVADERGLLSGTRTHTLRGRMPAALVAEAKLKTGISSDSKLLEAALANLAVADDYAEWLVSQRGTVSVELDLEF